MYSHTSIIMALIHRLPSNVYRDQPYLIAKQKRIKKDYKIL